MLLRILEVFLDVFDFFPWSKGFKEKRDLLREDPFLGYIFITILGLVFFFVTRFSPSWIGFFFHYISIPMMILGGFASLAAGWLGWSWYRYTAWPILAVTLLVYGCYDTYHITTTNDTPQQVKLSRGEQEGMLSTTQTDILKRFTSRPLERRSEEVKSIGGRTVQWTKSQGPLNASRQKQGRWEVTSIIPARSAPTVFWFWEDQPITETEWNAKQSGS